MGSSMGAYAALKYGSILEADKILALGPESELCIPLGRSVTSLLDYYEGYGDISHLVYKNPHNLLVVSGNNDLVDFYCACKIKDRNESIDVVLINNETHVVAKYLEKKFGLYQVVFDFFFRGKKEFLSSVEKGKLTDLKVAMEIKSFNESLAKKHVSIEYHDSIQSTALSHVRWSMIQYFHGLLLLKENKPQNACQAFELALDSQPTLARARLKLAHTKYACGMYEEAVKHLEYLAELNLTYSVADLLHKSYIANRRTDAAIEILKVAINLKLTPMQETAIRKQITAVTQKLITT